MKNKGFALADLAIALAIFGIVTSVLALRFFNEQKQEIAKEIASTLVAIDQGFNTLALSQQLIHNYRGEGKPVPFPTLTSSVTDETDYVEEVLRKSYSRNLQDFSYSGISFIDPRINLKNLARKGYTFTFNVVNGYTLASISVNGIDDEINSYLSSILKNKWDAQRKTFRLNDGRGYSFTPVKINKVVSFREIPYRECAIVNGFNQCGTRYRQVPVWDAVLLGYRLVANTTQLDNEIINVGDPGEIPATPDPDIRDYNFEKLEPALQSVVISALDRNDESILYSTSLIVNGVEITQVKITTQGNNVQIVNLSERNLASLLSDNNVIYVQRPFTVINNVYTCRRISTNTSFQICGSCNIRQANDELYIIPTYSCAQFVSYECTTMFGNVFYINTVTCNPSNTNNTN